jgi:hypothetical protein
MTMKFPLAIAACLGLVLSTMSAPGQAYAQGQNESGGGRLLVFNADNAAATSSGGVRILRGSAIAPRAAATPPQENAMLGPGRWQALAGRRLWLFDRETGKLASCRNRPTVNVGQRELECTFGTFSRYRRTFGNNFNQ